MWTGHPERPASYLHHGVLEASAVKTNLTASNGLPKCTDWSRLGEFRDGFVQVSDVLIKQPAALACLRLRCLDAQKDDLIVARISMRSEGEAIVLSQKRAEQIIKEAIVLSQKRAEQIIKDHMKKFGFGVKKNHTLKGGVWWTYLEYESSDVHSDNVQGSFCVCAQPMRDDVASKRRFDVILALSLRRVYARMGHKMAKNVSCGCEVISYPIMRSKPSLDHTQ